MEEGGEEGLGSDSGSGRGEDWTRVEKVRRMVVVGGRKRGTPVVVVVVERGIPKGPQSL